MKIQFVALANIILMCGLLVSCAPAKQTGTVTDGVVKGIAVGNDGSLGQLNVELTVKLDDGKEVKGSTGSIKTKRAA